ncbi:MAG: topoisomerase DNA-binding C4 zinc finger domain-containing protein [Oscillospiraceae bacterium]|nr:topoisomerase DNA-binding C4 zinc finger domain-containing protein [Oscillospiraceae bacterium]
MLLENAEQYPYAEERRLFYVALTRAKRKVYLVTVEGNISSFARDMINKYGEEMKKEEWSCPLCGGQLKRIKGRYGPFYGCSNYRSIGCRYTRKIRKSNADT